MNSVKKHGRENFEKSILYICETAFSAYALEEWLVERHGAHPRCVNLRRGGIGGFDHLTPEQNGTVAFKKKFKSDPDFRDTVLGNLRKGMSRITPEIIAANTRRIIQYNKDHPLVFTPEMKKAASESRKGDKNPQFGKLWITDGISAKQIISSELQQFELEGWTRGKKRPDPKPNRILKQDEHGTTGCYKRHGCRCEPCVAAYRKYYREMMRSRYDRSKHQYVKVSFPSSEGGVSGPTVNRNIAGSNPAMGANSAGEV